MAPLLVSFILHTPIILLTNIYLLSIPGTLTSQQTQHASNQQMFDILDVTNPDHADYYLPMFGVSPGGTPTVSSVSLTDSRSDLEDLSDVSHHCLIMMTISICHGVYN